MKIHYPDSDGKPIADNTKQFDEIVSLKWNLDALFADRPMSSSLGICSGIPWKAILRFVRRPMRWWRWGGPKGIEARTGNRIAEMLRKQTFYEAHGVVEYYVYDPDDFEFTVCLRSDAGKLIPQPATPVLVSPLPGIRFAIVAGRPWTIYRPDGERFKTYVEMIAERNAQRARADAERERAEAERVRAEAESARAARLRALGEDPDAAEALARARRFSGSGSRCCRRRRCCSSRSQTSPG